MIFRLRDYAFSPWAILRLRRRLGESETWDPARLRSQQQAALERTLAHAVTRVPYYRRTLGRHRSRFNAMIEALDLSELPILTKNDVRAHFAELQAENASRYSPSITQTSGSSGTPTQFTVDRSSHIAHFAAIWRVLNWAGYRFGDRMADLTGYIPRRGELFEWDPRLNCLHLSSFNFTPDNVRLYVERLRRFRPVMFKAYPSSLDLFCRWVREQGLEVPRPRSILTCAESLLEHQQASIRETFARPHYDFYNQNERAALISTCGEGRYHVHEEYSFVELVRPDGRAGAAGVVASTLHNRAMPLIRYDTGDLAELDDLEPCACGRRSRTVRRIVGRIEDIVITPDGRHVGRLDAAFKYSPGVRLSRIVQDRVESIRVELVRGPTYRPSDAETIERELRARLGDAIAIEFEFVADIPPERNGKIKFVVSAPGRAVSAGTSRAP